MDYGDKDPQAVNDGPEWDPGADAFGEELPEWATEALPAASSGGGLDIPEIIALVVVALMFYGLYKFLTGADSGDRGYPGTGAGTGEY